MNFATDALRRERTEAATALAAERLDPAQRPLLDGFAREWFRQLDADDIAERAPEDLSGALLSHLQFGAARAAGRPKVRVLSPSVDEHGWSSRHSVIEIVNDDMPFLVDSTTAEINRQGLTLHFIVHPIFAVERTADGQLSAIRPRAESPQAARESWMHIEVDRLIDPQQRTALVAGIERVLADVRAAVDDWKPMIGAPAARRSTSWRRRRRACRRPWRRRAAPFSNGWRRTTSRCSDIGSTSSRRDDGEDELRPVPGTGLGVLREGADETASAGFSAQTPAGRAFARSPTPPLVVTKANTRSTVHRPGYTDHIGVKRYDAEGRVTGEHRFLGLFTSTAYSARVSETPLLRGKVEAIAERAGLPPGGHLSKALDHILETYPRDELFQISDDELYETALGILALGDRQRLRLFVRRDPFDRFVSCLVYVPREAYATDLRVKFQRILLDAFAGSGADFDVLLGDTALARIHFMFARRRARCRRSTARRSRRGWQPRRGAGPTSCAMR